jgi:Zn-dependent protease with chaperone function
MRAYLTIGIWIALLLLVVTGMLRVMGQGIGIMIDKWHEFFSVCRAIAVSGWSFFTLPTNLGVIVLTIVVSIGFILMIIRVSREFYQLRMMKKELSLKTCYEQNSITVIDQNSFVAFSSGFFHPHVYISRGVIEQCNDEELRALIAHERYHQSHLHSWTRLCMQIIASLFFFIPGVHAMVTYLQLRQEFHADEAAIHATSRRTLAGMLLRIHTEEKYASSVAGFSALSQRVDRLLYPQASVISHTSIGMFTLGVISAILLTTLLFSQTRPTKVMAEISSSGEIVHCSVILKESIAPQFISREIRSSSMSQDHSSAFN